MKIYIRHMEHAEDNRYEIYDENGKIKYFVNTTDPFSRNLLRVHEETGREVGLMTIETLEHGSMIRMGMEGRMLGTVRIERNGEGLEISSSGCQIEGDPWNGNYKICVEGEPIIQVRREKQQMCQIDALDVSENRDERIAFFLVIAMDEAMQNRREKDARQGFCQIV